MVANLLYSHDLDLRYTDMEMKARLAALYLPLIGITIKALPQLYDPNTEGRYRSAADFESEMDTINQRVAMAIAGSNLFGRFSDQPSSDVSARVGLSWVNQLEVPIHSLYPYFPGAFEYYQFKLEVTLHC